MRRVCPRTSSSDVEYKVDAWSTCASGKNVESLQPYPSSRVRKMTRRPERTGGVCKATFTPATRTDDSERRVRRSDDLTAPIALSYSKEVGAVGLATSVDGSVALFKF